MSVCDAGLQFLHEISGARHGHGSGALWGVRLRPWSGLIKIWPELDQNDALVEKAKNSKNAVHKRPRAALMNW